MTHAAHTVDQRWSGTDLVAAYELLAEPLSRQYALEALATVGLIGAGRQILDVAAGTGSLSLPAAEAGARVLATDLSPVMVARLSEKLKAFSGCSAQVMDGQALDVPDGAFDASFSIFGIMLFSDWRRGLRELARSIRAGGHGCVVVWRERWGAPQFGLLADAFATIYPNGVPPTAPAGMLSLSSPDALRAEMQAAGFVDVDVRLVEGVWTGQSVDALVTDTRSIAHFVPEYAEMEQNNGGELGVKLHKALERYVAGPLVNVPSTALIAAGRRP